MVLTGTILNGVRLAILAALVAGALGIAAVAQAPNAIAAGEVFVDPGSPAGKEYALPVPRARSEASGAKSGSGAADSNPPIFGVGVSPGGGDGGAGGSKKGGRESGEASQTSSIVPQGGGFASGTTLPLAAAVLVLGAGLGVAARRMQRSAG